MARNIQGRWVLLHHELPEHSPRPSHWDWMLEVDGHLVTWALNQQPPSTRIAAELLPHHRLAYLDYEGPVSNDRGVVRQVANGLFQSQWPDSTPGSEDHPSTQALGKLKLEVRLDWPTPDSLVVVGWDAQKTEAVIPAPQDPSTLARYLAQPKLESYWWLDWS